MVFVRFLRVLSLSFLTVFVSVAMGACSKGGSSSSPNNSPGTPAPSLAGYNLYQSVAEGDIYARNLNREAVLLPNQLKLSLQISSSLNLSKLAAGSNLADQCQNTRRLYEVTASSNQSFAYFKSKLSSEIGELSAPSDLKQILLQTNYELKRQHVAMSLKIPAFRIEIKQYPRESLTRIFEGDPQGPAQLQEKIRDLVSQESVSFTAAELCDLLDNDLQIIGVIDEGFNHSFPIVLRGSSFFANVPH